MMASEYEEITNTEADFLVELINEVVFFVNKLWVEDTQPMRRAFCRSVFQFVDGIATDLKEDVYRHESPELIGDDYYLALQDRKIISKEGKEKVIKYRSGFAKNILFAFDIYGWTAGLDLDLRENPKEWNRFLRCITIRNRVVHPKTLEDMEISKSDVIDMLKMFIWLQETLLNAHEQVAKAWLKQAEAMKSAFNAQQKVPEDPVTSAKPLTPSVGIRKG